MIVEKNLRVLNWKMQKKHIILMFIICLLWMMLLNKDQTSKCLILNQNQTTSQKLKVPVVTMRILCWQIIIIGQTIYQTFSGPQPGPTQTLEANKNELDSLNFLFSEKFYSKISEETNVYAPLCIRAKANPVWYNTTSKEICDFLGCLVVMGIISAPAQDLYCSKDKLFHLSCIEERFTRG